MPLCYEAAFCFGFTFWCVVPLSIPSPHKVCPLGTIAGTVCLEFYNSRPHGNSGHAVFLICFRCVSWPWGVTSHTYTVFCWILERDPPQVFKIVPLTSSPLSGLCPNLSSFDLPGLSVSSSQLREFIGLQPGSSLLCYNPETP